MKSTQTLKRLCIMAVIAALYTAVSLALAPLSYGNIQVRVAEALTLLPILFPQSIAALALGCALTNLFGAMMGVNLLGFADVFVGTLATVLAAICTWKLRHVKTFNQPLLSALMPILFNGVIIGAELSFVLFPASQFMLGWLINGAEVAIGEAIACLVFGLPLIHMLKKADLVKRFGLH